jgi:hypothetical protein
MYEWRYEYDLYRFADGDIAFVARSYVEEPDEAHFLGIERAGKRQLLRDEHLRMPLFAESARYLRGAGKAKLRWLSGRGNGYEGVKLET